MSIDLDGIGAVVGATADVVKATVDGSTINNVAASKTHTVKVHERRPPVRVFLPRLGIPLCPAAAIGKRGSFVGVAQVSGGKCCTDSKAVVPVQGLGTGSSVKEDDRFTSNVELIC